MADLVGRLLISLKGLVELDSFNFFKPSDASDPALASLALITIFVSVLFKFSTCN